MDWFSYNLFIFSYSCSFLLAFHNGEGTELIPSIPFPLRGRERPKSYPLFLYKPVRLTKMPNKHTIFGKLFIIIRGFNEKKHTLA
jgi:hypothetical protein